MRVLAHLDVPQCGVGADQRTGRDRGRPEQLGVGQDGDVGFQVDVGLDPGGLRVGDRDAFEHPVLDQPAVDLCVHPGQLDAIVDALGLPQVVGQVGADADVLTAQVTDHVGDVELLLNVVRLQGRQPGAQQVGIEDVDAGVDLGDLPLGFSGVLVLDDAGDLALFPDDAPVTGRVGDHRGEHRAGVLVGTVGSDQGLQRFTAEHWDVAVGDHDLASHVGELLHSDRDGATGAVADCLLHGQRLRAVLRQVRLHLLAQVPNHHDQVPGFQSAGRVDGVAEHGTPGHRVQQLRSLRLHPGATAGCQDNDGCHRGLGGCGVHEISFTASKVPVGRFRIACCRCDLTTPSNALRYQHRAVAFRGGAFLVRGSVGQWDATRRAGPPGGAHRTGRGVANRPRLDPIHLNGHPARAHRGAPSQSNSPDHTGPGRPPPTATELHHPHVRRRSGTTETIGK